MLTARVTASSSSRHIRSIRKTCSSSSSITPASSLPCMRLLTSCSSSSSSSGDSNNESKKEYKRQLFERCSFPPTISTTRMPSLSTTMLSSSSRTFITTTNTTLDSALLPHSSSTTSSSSRALSTTMIHHPNNSLYKRNNNGISSLFPLGGSGGAAATTTAAVIMSRLNQSVDYQQSSLLFQRTMHNVILRAFSTSPSPAEDTSSTPPPPPSPPIPPTATSSSPDSTSQSSSFSSTTTSSPPQVKVPTPKPHSSSSSSPSIPSKIQNAIISASKSLTSFILSTPGVLWFYLTHPKDLKNKLQSLKEAAKKEANHYWMGSKLLAADIRTARQMLQKTLSGSPLSRRERKQLLRTLADLFRIVPMSIFVIIPFMEVALPFALRIWPNMLPSTFQDSLKAEENMKRELQSRINLAGFFQETLHEMAKDQKRQAAKRKEKSKSSNTATTNNGDSSPSSSEALSLQEKKEESAADFLEFLEKSRKGEMMPADVIIKYSNYFQDELTLDNMPRMQLINMCRYMNIPPFGSNNLLRFQLRHKIRTLKEDDQRILWEGIDSLTKMELREACQERGMRSTGLDKMSYRRALQQWLDLSVNKNVPISLLIMSRTFFLHDEMVESSAAGDVSSLAEAMSGLDKDVVNEVVLEMATPEEKAHDPEIRKIKLEVLEHQNEVIAEEAEEREREAEKKKKKETTKKAEAKEEVVVGEVVEPAAAAQDAVVVDQAQIITPSSVDSTTEKEEVQVAMDDTTKVEFGTAASSESDVKVATAAAAADVVSGDTVVPEEEKKVEAQAEVEKQEEEEEESKKQEDLSARDLEALSQLASRNPVQSERDNLERIKAAMLKDDEKEGKLVADVEAEAVLAASGEEIVDIPVAPEKETATVAAAVTDQDQLVKEEVVTTEPEVPIISSTDEDKVAAETIAVMDAKAEKEAESTTTFSTEGDIQKAEDAVVDATAAETVDTVEKKEEEQHEEEEEGSGDEKLDKAINRLKARVESMVGKIETQLSDVETRIGDKMHLLDKDMDGLVTTEEVAECLQTILKRDISIEQAKAIVEDMDKDEDGILTVKELAMWVETNKVIKLMEEGRDAEVDLLIIEQTEKLKAMESEDSDESMVKKEKVAES